MPNAPSAELAEQLAKDLQAYIDAYVDAHGGSTTSVKPGHRVPFHWPPHPISYKYHVLRSDWSGTSTVKMYGEEFDLQVARTPHGVFVRCDDIWHEERGETLEQATQNLIETSKPYFDRQFAIAESLGMSTRFKGHISELDPLSLMKLLYCTDRDVANEARTVIELHGSDHIFLPALLIVLNGRKHPNRRSAQWCVLDLFEDMSSFCKTQEEIDSAVAAIRSLIWDAEDDYARTIYKAGVVVGGHLPGTIGGPLLIDCLNAPSRIARRSAIHGLFHVVEWSQQMRESVVAAIRKVAKHDPEPLLREYAEAMANDIESAAFDHIAEPVFEDEE
ncbi:MAG: hypothetical protein KF784_07355 [Fimbriimonadaceae bacterium]|nr:hypothetical protein [Fimbriimonadaceae bacterium]